MKKLKEALEPFVKIYLEITKIDSELQFNERSIAVKSVIADISISNLRELYTLYNSLDEDDWIDPIKQMPKPMETVLAVMQVGSEYDVVEAWVTAKKSWITKSVRSNVVSGSAILWKYRPSVPVRLLEKSEDERLKKRKQTKTKNINPKDKKD